MYVRILSIALFLALSSFAYPTNSVSAQDVDAFERYAAGILKAYDKDSDGLLDSNEMKAMRRQPGKQADINGDGKLSKLELSASVKNLGKERAARALPETDPVQKRPSAYERYADGLLKNYDKDSDGFLNSKELKAMRRPPKKAADTDGDGKISKLELMASFTPSNRIGKAYSAKQSTEAKELEKLILQRIEEKKKERRPKDLERQILEKIQDGQAELSEPAQAKRDELEQLILERIEERKKAAATEKN